MFNPIQGLSLLRYLLRSCELATRNMFFVEEQTQEKELDPSEPLKNQFLHTHSRWVTSDQKPKRELETKKLQFVVLKAFKSLRHY